MLDKLSVTGFKCDYLEDGKYINVLGKLSSTGFNCDYFEDGKYIHVLEYRRL